MPRAPKKCATCETRVTGRTYCSDCQPIGWDSGPKPRTSTAEHKTWRRDVLKRDKGTCQIRGPQCLYRATEADHIIPIAEGGIEGDLTNGQAACVPCHKAKTSIEAARGRQRAAK